MSGFVTDPGCYHPKAPVIGLPGSAASCRTDKLASPIGYDSVAAMTP